MGDQKSSLERSGELKIFNVLNMSEGCSQWVPRILTNKNLAKRIV
jgi:hypothetical protein